jgi:hypothetical protein
LKYHDVFLPPFNEGTHWALPASAEVVEAMQTLFANRNAYPVDGRAVSYSMAYFSAKHLGEGQFYLMTIVDKKGQPFDGGSTYRLTVPPNAPVRLYWSATVYDPHNPRSHPEHAVVQPLVSLSKNAKEC